MYFEQGGVVSYQKAIDFLDVDSVRSTSHQWRESSLGGEPAVLSVSRCMERYGAT